MTDYYTLWAHQIKTPIAAARLLLQEDPVAVSGEVEVELLKIEQYVDMVLGYLRLDSESTDYVLAPATWTPSSARRCAASPPPSSARASPCATSPARHGPDG